jgi:hypothetical protein
MPPTPPETPAAPYLADSYIFNWQNSCFRSDLLFVVPIAICLAAGLAAGHPGGGLIAAGGAMTIGFGAKQDIDNSRLLPMILAALGIAFSIFVGMVAGHRDLFIVLVAASWGFGYGMLSARPAGYGWVAQQCLITLLVGSAFPFSVKQAGVRGALLLAGGALQVVISSVGLHLLRQLGTDLKSLGRYAREEGTALRDTFADTASMVRGGYFADSPVPYALRMMVTLGVSTEIYRRLHFSSGYWIPMTALLVLKPGITDTASRAIARTVGTIAGAWGISVLVQHLAPTPLVLALLVTLFAWLAYATLNVNYALYAVFLTGYIVFLLSLAELPGRQVAERRAICTLLGGVIALSVRLVVIYRRGHRRALKEAGHPGLGEPLKKAEDVPAPLA